MNRRTFIERLFLTLAVGGAAPSLLSRTARAASAGERILVVVQMTGGNDALNTLVPYKNADYYKLRPNLAVTAAEVLDLDGRHGLHPGLRPLMAQWERGRLLWIPSVGYPNPNRSHFVSMAVWHSADPERRSRTGWLGELVDESNDPFCAVNFGMTTPLALRGESAAAVSMGGIDGFSLKLPDPYLTALHAGLERPRSGELEATRKAMAHLVSDTQRVSELSGGFEPRAEYPKNSFGRSLRDVVRMIGGGLEAKVYYVSLNGFDTHSDQLGRQPRLLESLSAGLAAFQQDLRDLGREDDVLVLGFSEFGRRVAENASGGTDHGKAGAMFALGPVNGGIHGKDNAWNLDELDDGDLRYRVDFRSVYAGAASFIGADPAQLFPEPQTPLRLFG